MRVVFNIPQMRSSALKSTAPSYPVTHFAVVVIRTMPHDPKRDQHAWGSNVRARGKPRQGVCFGLLYKNDPMEKKCKMIWKKNQLENKAKQRRCEITLKRASGQYEWGQ